MLKIKYKMTATVREMCAVFFYAHFAALFAEKCV